MYSHLKVHKKWIICENYTPNGVVVVVDVVPANVTTVEGVVIIEVGLFLWFIIHFKNTILNELKKCKLYFYEYHNFSNFYI